MRLADFISANVELILVEWEAFARSLTPGTKLEIGELRDDAESILHATVRDMRTFQNAAQQVGKSQGHGGAGGPASDGLDAASSVHGAGRVGSGFNVMEVVAEYRALRATVLRLWQLSNPDPDVNDLDDVTRFNESIDQSLAKAIGSYTKRVDQARRMFLGILAHDLRNPLNTIALSAHVVSSIGPKDPNSSQMLRQIETSVQAISRLIRDLTDFATSGLGEAMPLAPIPMNLEPLVAEVVREVQASHPARRLACHTSGDLTLIADAARLRQVLSNLLGNAIQHGSSGTPVTVKIAPEGTEIVIKVHNFGRPIPRDVLPTLFDPLVRGSASPDHARGGSVGLGLYIVRETVTAHRGRIDVTSSEADGTLFTVRLPRRAAVPAAS
jgi:signal transduction histidine kinase